MFDHEIEISRGDSDIILTGFPKINRKILLELGVKIKNDN
jgi:ATP-dependent RNA circularization protein (DNA/RNA ligase family)